jgi:hypothetical protein
LGILETGVLVWRCSAVHASGTPHVTQAD